MFWGASMLTLVQAANYKETSGLDLQLEMWMPQEVPSAERDEFKHKFYRLADAVKPIVGAHTEFETHNIGGIIRDSQTAEYLNLYFEYSSAKELVEGFSNQLL